MKRRLLSLVQHPLRVGQRTRPRGNLAYYLQPYRSLFTGGASVRRPQGVSIPRSAAERREIAISSQLLRQHPAAAFEKRNLLCFLSNSCSEQSASCLLNQMAGLLKRNYFFAAGRGYGGHVWPGSSICK